MYAARHAAPSKNHRIPGTLTAAALLSVAVPAMAEAATTVGSGTPTATTILLSDSATAYQLDSIHDGHLVGGSEAPGAPQKWARDLGGNVSYPIIVKGHVFVTVAKTSGYGTVLHALDPQTGQDQWTADLGGTYWQSSLTYGQGMLFALTYDGALTAFNPTSGAVIWNVQLPGQYMFTAPPTYSADGALYVSGAGSGGTLYKINLSTGAVDWTQSVMNGDSSSPAVTDSGVFVGYACQQDYSFDPAAGTPLWHHSTGCEGGGGATPTVGGGAVWFNDAVLGPIALDPATGAVSTAKGPATWSANPAFDAKHGFFMVNGVLTSQNNDSDTPRWTFSGDGQLTGSPLVVHGYVYIGSASGKVFAVNETTGALAWTGDAGAPIGANQSSGPITALGAGQGLVVVPASTRLVAYGN